MMTTPLQPSGDPSLPVRCHGVRGATTVTENTKDAILEATREMLYIMIRVNQMQPEDVASAYFTTTVDLNASYPALAARQLGWYEVALLCGHEMQVPGGLDRCIRVLVHWNTSLRSKDIIHVYLREAKTLRPDRKTLPEIPEEEIAAAIRDFDLDSLKFDLSVGIPPNDQRYVDVSGNRDRRCKKRRSPTAFRGPRFVYFDAVVRPHLNSGPEDRGPVHPDDLSVGRCNIGCPGRFILVISHDTLDELV